MLATKAAAMAGTMAVLPTLRATTTSDDMAAITRIQLYSTVTRRFPSQNHISSRLDILSEVGLDSPGIPDPVGP